jgi:hypothetical protein
MTRIRAMAAGLFVGLLILPPAIAKTMDVEFLQGTIDGKNIENLGGLACRNYDHIVHIDISVDWPDGEKDAETAGHKRLIFWNDKAEYLFPDGSYSFLHGSYVIDGYFIPRRGGVHQGVVSIAFSKVDAAQVLLNPVNQIPAQGPNCP